MPYIDTEYLFRCDTCRNFRNNVCRTFCESGEGYSPNMSKIPPADVAPRAEVDRLKKDNEYILMQHRFQRRPDGDCWNDVIEKAKVEAVSEIFAEIKEQLRGIFDFFRQDNDIRESCAIMFAISEVDKIEKKYTEDRT